MYHIYSETDDKVFDAGEEQSLLDSSLRAGIRHTHVCGGNARCSTCRVLVTEGLEHCRPRNEAEMRMSSRLNLPGNIRLACQTSLDGDIRMRRLAVDDLDARIMTAQLDIEDGRALGQEREIAVLFADLSNYTSFAESLPAFDVVHVLNRYYLTMNRIIEAHHGVISDVAGDGMLVLFGACGKGQGQVSDAIRAVRAMHVELAGFNTYLKQMYQRGFGLRAGIHFGTAIVGNFSTGPMNKVAAIGDTVNLASRIEQANKRFDSKLLISQYAYEQVRGEFDVSAPHACELKGKSGMYNLYEVAISADS
ncbi:MAG: adenylate/guanylate cyclase domain-containing protein [Mariprofundaceae bacterium]|nr:adenylate/guanylate cyclase domain-containing protein [Mariprofundaceae bacterium]